MHIVVCVKDIPNPEAPAVLFSVDRKAMRMQALSGLSNVTSPFDEQALELALREKDRCSDVRITAMSLGPKSSLQAVKRALAVGADDGVHIHDANARAESSMVAAHVLAIAIRDLGSVDLVITGRQAADWDVGIVGCGIAELLRWPVVCVAGRMHAKGRFVEVDRSLEDGSETVRSALPCVITASNEVGPPRKASLRETMKAGKKQIIVQEVEELWPVDSVKAAGLSLPRRIGLSEHTSSVECQYLAEDAGTAAHELFKLLRQEGLGLGDNHA